MFDADPVRLAQPFPADFAWGFAASAYQIEGAAAEDGRGRSIWDTFSRVPGAIADGQHRRRRLRPLPPVPRGRRAHGRDRARRPTASASAGPRVQPDGTGAANERGLDFYDRLVDALLAAGVQPLVNLFHWDLPQALQDRGGFADPQVVGWFAEYAALVASRLGDRVSDWMTFNEPAVFAFLGHADGIHAPGLRDWPTALRVADNQLRAHAAAAAAIRSLVEGARIGIAFDVNQVVPGDRHGPRPASPPRSGAPRATPGSSIRCSAAATRQLGLEAHGAAGHLEGVELADPPAGRPRLPGPELLPARRGQRQVGSSVRLGDRRRDPARSRRRWAGRSRPTACATSCWRSTASTRRARS